MGRGRGRGRKIIPNGRSHQDYKGGSSGEEVVPARKRRGRPQKQRVPAAEKPDLDAEAKILVEGVHGSHQQRQGEEGDDAELKEKNYSEGGNGSKRNRVPKQETGSADNHDLEENSSSTTTRSSNDESTAARSGGGFRLNGSRRKSTPRRAAEAGL